MEGDANWALLFRVAEGKPPCKGHSSTCKSSWRAQLRWLKTGWQNAPPQNPGKRACSSDNTLVIVSLLFNLFCVGILQLHLQPARNSVIPLLQEETEKPPHSLWTLLLLLSAKDLNTINEGNRENGTQTLSTLHLLATPNYTVGRHKNTCSSHIEAVEMTTIFIPKCAWVVQKFLHARNW